MTMRKNLRKELKQSTDIKERQHLKARIRIIKENIVDMNKKIRGVKVKKIAEQIRSNINHRTKIWKVKRRIEEKTLESQVKHQTAARGNKESTTRHF